MDKHFTFSKKIILLACLCTTYFFATSFTQKKIAQRRDQYFSGAWQGIDSIIWQYNGNEDSIQKYSIIYNAGTWSPLQNNLFTYNVAGYVTTYLRQNWINGTWVNASQFVSTYDINNNELEYEKQVWNSGTWAPTQKIIRTFSGTNKVLTENAKIYYQGTWVDQNLNTYAYDSQDSIATIIFANYDAGSASFIPTVKKTYAWNSVGLLNTYQEFNWNTASTAWQYKKTITNYYNSNNLVYTSVTKKDTFLMNDTKSDYTYDANTLKVASVIVSNSDSSNLWFNYRKYEYNYNADTTVLDFVVSKPDLNNWVTDSSAAYTYTSFKKISTITHAKNGGSGLIEVQKSSYNYDAKQNNIYYLLQDKTGAQYVNNLQSFYYYNQFPLGIKNLKSNHFISIYPNPCADFITIENSKLFNNNLEILIYNTKGQLVQHSTQNSQSNQISISHLNVGDYILQITNGDKVWYSRFQKQ